MGQSRGVIAAVVVGLSWVLPGLLCLGAALAAPGSLLGTAAVNFAAAAWMALLFLVNWWEFSGLWLRWAWVLTLLAAVTYRAVVSAGHAVGLAGSSQDASIVVIGLAGAWLLGTALAARRHPGGAVELALPFSGDGRFLVTDGGDGARSFLVNYHYGFGAHRASGVARSMRFALDVVEIGAGGTSSEGFLPRRNEAFRIWGRSVLAPCDGVVEHVENGVDDNDAFGTRRPYGLGNHVVIRTDDDVFVVLGHMRRGSVEVAPGEAVRVGDRIGAVGNSGWTERPHLHMQAMRSTSGDLWHGDPVPMLVDGRFLVRNMVVRIPETGSGTHRSNSTRGSR